MSITKVTGMMQTSTKGGDISSASPCVIDSDGDVFDVTGTTNFAAFTVAAGRRFTLNFDSALTMTHHATNLDLPAGGANITTAAGDVAEFFATGTNTVQCVNYTKADGTAVVAAAGGKLVQVVSSAGESYETTKATATTTAPVDDTIMQNDEGSELMTLAITPTSASNKLLIHVNAMLSTQLGDKSLSSGLFQDTTANALATNTKYCINPNSNEGGTVVYSHYMTSGTTSSTTFKLRAGADSGNAYINVGASANRHGGATAKSWMQIWEIAV